MTALSCLSPLPSTWLHRATFGVETYGTQELVDAWRTAASASDGVFSHDIPLDDFPAAHGPFSDAPSAPHAGAQDEQRIEPRGGGAFDCRTPRSASEDTDGRGGICSAPQNRLNVEGVAGLPAAGSGLRAESTQPICHGDEMRSPTPSRPQSIAAASADGPVTEDPFGGLNVQSNAPVVQSSESTGLADDAARPALESGRLLAEHNKDSCGRAGPLNQASGAVSDGSDDEGAPYVPRRWRGRPRHPSPSIFGGCASDAAGGTIQSVSSPFHSPPGRQAQGPSTHVQRCRAPQRQCPARPRKRRAAREASGLSSTPQPNEPRWAVDRIVSSVRRKGKLFYRVRWEDTWEPAEGLHGGADIAIAEFLALTSDRTKMPRQAASGII
ncbi:hypothetical protein LTR02_017728 [Friedmanniomyces endolithicus]|nr:hypothetical protein LTR02_017728 [Friedmanniomyces endolithicus]